MEIKYTLEILTKDIQDIEKLVVNLQNSPEGSALEMDLALSKLRNVYEILTMIREDRIQHRGEPRSHAGDAPIPRGAGEDRQEGTGEKAVAERPEPIAAQSGTGHEEIAPVQETGKMPSQKSKSEVQTGSRKETGILAEKFSTESSINENMATRRGNDMDTKLKGQPIESISRSIGINDRFFIIRELFNGDASGFRSLLDQLDSAASYEDTSLIIGERFPGQMEHEGVSILQKLINRKFRR